MYSMYFLNNLKLLCLQRKRTIIRIVVRSFISFFLWYWTYSTWENDNQTLLQVLEMMTIITRLPHFMCYKFLLYQYWYIWWRILCEFCYFFLWNSMLTTNVDVFSSETGNRIFTKSQTCLNDYCVIFFIVYCLKTNVVLRYGYSMAVRNLYFVS